MKRLSFIFLSLLLVISARGEAATLHALIVADTHASNIQESVEKDLIKMERFVSRAAKFSELDMNKLVFKGFEANSNFASMFDESIVEDDDVILFYWSGHGYRGSDKDQDNNPWPSFCFENDYIGMDQMDITEYLESKHPRLVITITDTCNEYIPVSSQPPMQFLVSKGGWVRPKNRTDIMKANYRKLFRNTSGVIMAAGSMPGQYSWCNESGAFFTSFFIEAFESEIKMSHTGWDAIYSKSSENFSSRLGDLQQTPLILLDISED